MDDRVIERPRVGFSVVVRGLRNKIADGAFPHLAARCARRSADTGVGYSCRTAAKNRRIWPDAHSLSDLSGGSPGSQLADRIVWSDLNSLRGAKRNVQQGFEEIN